MILETLESKINKIEKSITKASQEMRERLGEAKNGFQKQMLGQIAEKITGMKG